MTVLQSSTLVLILQMRIQVGEVTPLGIGKARIAAQLSLSVPSPSHIFVTPCHFILPLCPQDRNLQMDKHSNCGYTEETPCQRPIFKPKLCGTHHSWSMGYRTTASIQGLLSSLQVCSCLRYSF